MVGSEIQNIAAMFGWMASKQSSLANDSDFETFAHIRSRFQPENPSNLTAIIQLNLLQAQ